MSGLFGGGGGGAAAEQMRRQDEQLGTEKRHKQPLSPTTNKGGESYGEPDAPVQIGMDIQPDHLAWDVQPWVTAGRLGARRLFHRA